MRAANRGSASTSAIRIPLFEPAPRIIDIAAKCLDTRADPIGGEHHVNDAALIGELSALVQESFGLADSPLFVEQRTQQRTAAIVGGWFHSGDLGYRDEDGFYLIVDRMKDMIIRGGYNVYPREVEEVLYEHPAIAEAAVVGTPHPAWGEEVCAVVALKPGSAVTPDEIQEFVKARIAAYKYPRLVQIVEALPKVSME